MMASLPRHNHVFVGTCAWSFEDWRSVFYPPSLPRNRWLQFYAKHFHVVELDSSFYHMPSSQTVKHWSELVGPEFRFCPKLPQTLSHEKRLENPAPEIAIMQQLAEELGLHFGCALLQLPPSFHAGRSEEIALRAFLRAWPQAVPLAIEFRDESWEMPRIARLLKSHDVTLVWADTLPLEKEKHTAFGFFPVTSSRLYIRLLGDFRTKYEADGRETHRYDRLLWPREKALTHWATKLRCHRDVETIYILANNHYEGMAVETAYRVASYLDVELPAKAMTSPPTEQADFFEKFNSI